MRVGLAARRSGSHLSNLGISFSFFGPFLERWHTDGDEPRGSRSQRRCGMISLKFRLPPQHDSRCENAPFHFAEQINLSSARKTWVQLGSISSQILA